MSVSIQIRSKILLGLTWVQTVWKGYKTTEVSTSKERINLILSSFFSDQDTILEGRERVQDGHHFCDHERFLDIHEVKSEQSSKYTTEKTP